MKEFLQQTRLWLASTTILLAAPASAYDFEVDGIYYQRLPGKNVEVTFNNESDNSYSGNVNVPDSVMWEGSAYEVVMIGDRAFANCGDLYSITLPRTVFKIGERAFEGCSSLSTVTCLSQTPPTIGTNAFNNIAENATLKIIDAYESFRYISSSFATVEHIYANTTDNLCGYPNVTWSLSENTTTDSSAQPTYTLKIDGEGIMMDFSEASPAPWAEYAALIDSVSISDNVTALGRKAFDGCTNLPVENYVRYAGKWAIGVTDKTKELYVLRENTIGLDATFVNCTNMRTLDLPESLRYIGYGAFEIRFDHLQNNGAGLLFLTIPNNVEYIGDFAFSNRSLEGSFHIPGNVKRIGNSAFSGSSVVLTIDDGVEEIGRNCFSRMRGYSDQVLPNTLKNIADCAFQYGGLNSVIIPSSVLHIGNGAFLDAGINEVSFSGSEGLLDISDYAFGNCRTLRRITFPKTLRTIGNSAFSGCQRLTSLVIPDNVNSIGESAFSTCSNLSKLVLGKNLQMIGRNAFRELSKMACVTNRNPVPVIIHEYNPFQAGGVSQRTLEVYEESVEDYRNAQPWDRSFANIVGMQRPASDVIDNISYQFMANGSASVVGYEGGGSVVIPAQVVYNGKTYSVVSIAPMAFADNQEITSLAVSEGIQEIGAWAFQGCTGLTELSLPEGLTALGQNAFAGCRSLTRLNIPSTLTEVDLFALRDCESLAYVEFNSYICLLNVLPNLKEVSLGNNITVVDNSMFYHCEKLEKVNFGENVEMIGDYAFAGCKALKEMYIPETVTMIRDNAFRGCISLEKVVLPQNITYIGNETFFNCSSLKEIVVPENVQTVGARAFFGCTSLSKAEFASIEHLCRISLGDTYSNPLSYARNLYIKDQKIDDLVIPETVTEIGGSTFVNCNLNSICIPASVTKIGAGAFTGSTGLEIENDIYYADKWAVGKKIVDNSQEDAQCVLRDNTVGLADRILEGTHYTTVMLPASVMYIGDVAFGGCASMENITLPENLKSLGMLAFINCTALKSISIPGSVMTIHDGTFDYCTNLSEINLSEGLESIGNCLMGCTALTSFTIPSSVTEISEWLFRECSSLQRLEVLCDFLPELSGCSQLKEIHLGNKITSIPDNAFANMETLENVYLGENVQSIGAGAFIRCSGLTSINLPNSVTAVGESAFSECAALKSITLSSNMTIIRMRTFYRCLSLTDISIPEGVTAIDSYAFNGCNELISMELPPTLSEIGRNAFSGCRKVVSIVSKNEIPPVCQRNAFQFSPDCVIQVPMESVETYQTAYLWQEYKIIGMETGIHSLYGGQSGNGQNIYDMTGRKVLHPQKGSIYIVNGKKVAY